MSPLAPLSRRLAALDARSRRRVLSRREGVDFASNDYLGLARDPAIASAIARAAERGVPAGSGGSRLLRGNAPEHEALEEKAAAFFGAKSALFLNSGFSANAALFATLPQPGDLIVADELIHASVHEGMRMSRAAHVLAKHGDAQAVADAIAAWRADGGRGTPWIAVESVYSMDGDIAPLADLLAVADAHDGVLIVDEAHGTGIFGPGGRGLAAPFEGRDNVITVHTCGKAMGVEGALITGASVVKDYLVNKARGFIFSTSPSPLMAVAVSAAIDRIEEADDLRGSLDAMRVHAGQVLCAPLGLPEPVSPIVPIILGTDARAMAAAAALQEAGFDIRGIRPPTVPAGTARLRVTLTLNATLSDIDAVAPIIQRVVEARP